MCRIVGFWDKSFKGDYDIHSVIVQMRDTMIRGGPDHGGEYFEEDIGLAIGVRRLAILDPSPSGNQPITDGRFYIVHNGEVYNFLEIRRELEKKGYVFRSKTDTEVILYAFREWGFDSVLRFRGMWAFAIWDKLERKLILCRDRYGVKPLYWYFLDDVFMFSSEIKAFLKHPKFKKELDLASLNVFLALGCIVSPKSILRYVSKLEPSHFLVFSGKNIEKIRYYDVRKFFVPMKISESEAEEKLKDIMRKSFKLRMVSDVPVGVFLSGGVDSSLVCSLLSEEGFKLKTFTIGTKDRKYDESGYAREVAKILRTDHNEMIVDFPSVQEILYGIPEIYDEPFADSSAIPTRVVSEFARRYVKVSLSADGGDELFLGYPKYTNPILKLGKFLRFISIAKFILNRDFVHPKIKRVFSKLSFISSARNIFEIYLYANSSFLPDTIRKVLKGEEELKEILSYIVRNYSNDIKDSISSVQCFDFMTIFPDTLLMKVDRASMSVSLEVREPFLDNFLVEFSASLPLDLKIRSGITKYILRKILLRYLPKELVFRPKMGFSIPIEKWAKEHRIFHDILSEQRLKKVGVLNPQGVRDILKIYDLYGIEFSRLWFLACFQLWAEKYL